MNNALPDPNPGIIERLVELERGHERLVRQCRRWKRAAAGVLAGLVVVLAAGAADRLAETLEARQFVLRDEAGGRRAALTIRPDGTPGLGLFGKDGTVRLSLDLSEKEAPGVNLYDARGTLRAALAIRPDGTPAVGLFDKDGEVRRSIEIGAEDGPAAGAPPELRAGR